MAVEAVIAIIEIRRVSTDHFFMKAGEVSVGKLNGVGKIDGLFQEVWTSSEGFEDPGNLFASRTLAPVLVGFSYVACGFSVFDDFDFSAHADRGNILQSQRGERHRTNTVDIFLH